MSGGTIDAAAIAGELTASERFELLALDDDERRKAPPLAVSAMLLFAHGIPLIAVKGDWARRNRTGARVCGELKELAS